MAHGSDLLHQHPTTLAKDFGNKAMTFYRQHFFPLPDVY
jgi:hypothetical protein